MKKIVITFLFLLFSISIYSQTVTFFGGIKPFDNKGSNLIIYYYDQTNETNSLYNHIYFNKKELYNIGVTIGAVDLKTKLYFDVYAQAFFNKMYGGDFGLQIGYVHPYFLTKRFSIFPTVGVGYGFHDLDIGDIINSNGSIQINGTKFNDKSLSVNFRKDFIALRPSLNFYFEISKKISLQVTGSYLYTFDFKDGLHFYGKDSKKSESVYLSSNNVTFLSDGIKKTELPYSFKGFEIRLGVGFILGSNPKEKSVRNEKDIVKEGKNAQEKQKSDSAKINNTELDLYSKYLSDAQNAYNGGKYLLVLELLKDFPMDNDKYGDAVVLMNKAIEKLNGIANQNFVTVSGRINCNCNKLISGYVVFEDMGTRSNVGKCRITSDGYYCIILPSGKIYSYYIDAKDFYPISKVVDFTSSKQNLNHKDNIVLVSYEEMKEKQLAVRINNIFFDFNKSELKPESYSELDRLYNFLKDNSDIKVEISGHTDNYGSDEYNMNLSQSRANTVKEYLVGKGIDSGRIIPIGYGESKPVSTNDTEEGRQLNRRVEFKILK